MAPFSFSLILGKNSSGRNLSLSTDVSALSQPLISWPQAALWAVYGKGFFSSDEEDLSSANTTFYPSPLASHHSRHPSVTLHADALRCHPELPPKRRATLKYNLVAIPHSLHTTLVTHLSPCTPMCRTAPVNSRRGAAARIITQPANRDDYIQDYGSLDDGAERWAGSGGGISAARFNAFKLEGGWREAAGFHVLNAEDQILRIQRVKVGGRVAGSGAGREA
ncbi:hypothetical protein FB45DRAFT_876185 [Roridomyces roridus]|uniref:Uncharacterized protein n=1 Tax=Roridomyces roridus TaxID=1738132 RepID=A0AAD7B3Z4_9AGAR|nr:hypothetical protein FB45DRAFT_876185 [Roridomyces roridus]